MNMKCLFIVSIFLFILIACDLFDDDGPKDPRDYTWTIDTLKHPDPTNIQLRLTRIWASSPDDIYIVGHSSTVFGSLWHFNGDVWSPVPIIKMNGGPIENKHYGIKDIFGFSRDNIWAVGHQLGKNSKYDAFVIHYNGHKWKEITSPDTSRLESVIGGNDGEVWVGPWGGGVFKYDGKKWNAGKINFPKDHGNTSYVHSFAYQENNPLYMFYLNQENLPRYFSKSELYKNKGDSWNFIVDEHDYYIGPPWISENGYVYFGGDKIIKIDGNTIESIWEFPEGFGVSKLHGIRDNYIFGCGRYLRGNLGNIVFFDGNEWTMLLEENLVDIFFTDIWTDGKIVLALGNSHGKTFIVKGE